MEKDKNTDYVKGYDDAQKFMSGKLNYGSIITKDYEYGFLYGLYEKGNTTLLKMKKFRDNHTEELETEDRDKLDNLISTMESLIGEANAIYEELN